jgi:hypothetical protein
LLRDTPKVGAKRLMINGRERGARVPDGETAVSVRLDSDDGHG